MRLHILIFSGLAAGGSLALGSGPLAAEPTAGKKIFVDNKCQACHSVTVEGIGVDESTKDAGTDDAEAAESTGKEVSPPDLSGVGNELKAEFIDGYLRKKEMIEGRKHKKRFRGSPEERATLVAWLVTLKAENKGTGDKSK